MSRSLLILVAGDPVPSAKQRFGGFDSMIRRATGSVWSGGWKVLDLRDGPELPAPSDLDGVIVSGSPHSIEDDAAWIQRGVDYAARLTQANVPTLGICFGHQMLGAALGGRVTKNPLGREIGSVSLDVFQNNPLLDTRASDEVRNAVLRHVNSTHMDSVVKLPHGAASCARTELEPNALVRFGEVSWGVQFHPEIDREIIRCYIQERREVLEAEGLDPDALSEAAHDADYGRSAIASFVRNVVGV